MTGPQGMSCPGCGQPPGFTLAGGRQAFCMNDGCGVLSWDPECTLEELMAGAAYVRLESRDGDAP